MVLHLSFTARCALQVPLLQCRLCDSTCFCVQGCVHGTSQCKHAKRFSRFLPTSHLNNRMTTKLCTDLPFGSFAAEAVQCRILPT